MSTVNTVLNDLMKIDEGAFKNAPQVVTTLLEKLKELQSLVSGLGKEDTKKLHDVALKADRESMAGIDLNVGMHKYAQIGMVFWLIKTALSWIIWWDVIRVKGLWKLITLIPSIPGFVSEIMDKIGEIVEYIKTYMTDITEWISRVKESVTDFIYNPGNIPDLVEQFGYIPEQFYSKDFVNYLMDNGLNNVINEIKSMDLEEFTGIYGNKANKEKIIEFVKKLYDSQVLTTNEMLPSTSLYFKNIITMSNYEKQKILNQWLIL